MFLNFFFFTIVHAQKKYTVVNDGNQYRIVGLYSNIDRKSILKGHPYLKEEFEIGEIAFKDKIIKESMRYNAYLDEFELPKSEGKTIVLKKDSTVKILFKKKKYLYMNALIHGKEEYYYLNPINEGPTILFKRISKDILPFKKPENGYEVARLPEFIINTEYFLKRKDRPALPLAHLSRKEVCAVLWDKYSKLRKYARKSKLLMRNEEEVIKVISYYDSLKKEEREREDLEK